MGNQLQSAGPHHPFRIDADSQYALELAVSAKYFKMHSEFLAYSAADRDGAIWQYIRERQTCQGCGTRPDEWDPDKGGHRAAYFPQITVCQGCIGIERLQEKIREEEGRGMRVGLRRNPDAE